MMRGIAAVSVLAAVALACGCGIDTDGSADDPVESDGGPGSLDGRVPGPDATGRDGNVADGEITPDGDDGDDASDATARPDGADASDARADRDAADAADARDASDGGRDASDAGRDAADASDGATTPDASVDAGLPDATVPVDAGLPDATVPPIDAGLPDATLPDDGGPSDPIDSAPPPPPPPPVGSQLPCGATTCPQATQSCCVTGGVPACVPRGGACGGVTIECGDKADCTGGDVCCFALGRATCTSALLCGLNRQVCNPAASTNGCPQLPLATSCKVPDGAVDGYGVCEP